MEVNGIQNNIDFHCMQKKFHEISSLVLWNELHKGLEWQEGV